MGGVLILAAALVVSCATNQPSAPAGSSSQSVSDTPSTDPAASGPVQPRPSGSQGSPSNQQSNSPSPSIASGAPAPPASGTGSAASGGSSAAGGTSSIHGPAPAAAGNVSPASSGAQASTTGVHKGDTPAGTIVPSQPQTGAAGGTPGSGAVQSSPAGSGGVGQAGSGDAGSRGAPQASGNTPTQGAGQTTSSPQTPQSLHPLSPNQINSGILANAGPGAWPLSDHGQALEVSRRASAAGNPEIFAVFVDVKKEAEAEVSTLSDFSRLFKQNLTPVEFSLVEFRQDGGRLERVKSFSLGKYMVFESLRVIAIHKGYDLPFAVTTTFQTQEGSNEVWVTFSQAGTSQITLQQTLSRSPIIEDINNDGYLDIIIKERGIEEGTGYETFLTWYKWDGRAYKEYKTTNIVRNLREFLNHASELLSADKVEEFLQSSLLPRAVAALRAKGLGNEGIFFDVFHLLPSSPDNPNDPLTSLGSIQQVIFPNIFENPFTEQDMRGYSFPMTVRFVTADGVSHFYGAKVYMHKDPFVEPQFSFATEHK